MRDGSRIAARREGRLGPRAASLVAGALAVGAAGLMLLRADSAYYTAPVIAVARRAGALFSITVPANRGVHTAIAAIAGDTWTAIRYPGTVWDEQGQC